MAHDIKTKQKVFGLKGREYEGVEWCEGEVPDTELRGEESPTGKDRKDSHDRSD